MANYKVQINNDIYTIENQNLVFSYNESFSNRTVFAKSGKYQSKNFTFFISYKDDSEGAVAAQLKNFYDIIYNMLATDGQAPTVRISMVSTIGEDVREAMLFNQSVNDITYNITPDAEFASNPIVDNINIELVFLNCVEK